MLVHGKERVFATGSARRSHVHSCGGSPRHPAFDRVGKLISIETNGLDRIASPPAPVAIRIQLGRIGNVGADVLVVGVTVSIAVTGGDAVSASIVGYCRVR